MSWMTFIGAIIQLVFLILSNVGNKDKEVKEKNDALSKELHEAIKSNDNARITLVLERIRLYKK